MADDDNNSNPPPGDGIDINEMSAMLEGIMSKDDTNIGEELNNSMDLYWGKRAPFYKLLEKALKNVGGNPPNSPKNPVNNAIPKENPIDKENRLGMRRLFKTKFFDNVLKGLKGIIASAGGILMDFLEFFLFMAFVDPSGSLLKSLIMIFFKIFTMIVGIIIRLIPTAIKLMINTGKLLYKEILKMIPILAESLIQVFDQLGKEYPALKKIFGAFSDFFKDIKKGFTDLQSGKIGFTTLLLDLLTSAFTGAFELLGASMEALFLSQFQMPELTEKVSTMGKTINKATKIFASGVIGLLIYNKIMNLSDAIVKWHTTTQKAMSTSVTRLWLKEKAKLVWDTSVKLVKWGVLWAWEKAKLVWDTSVKIASITATWIAEKALTLGRWIGVGTTWLMVGAQTVLNAVMSANPIMLVVIAVIAFFAMIWLFKDRIVSFFEAIGKYISNLWATAGPVLKAFMIFLGILLSPIILVGLAIYGLAKLFQSIATDGFPKTWEKIKKAIKKFFTNFMNFISDSLDKIRNYVKDKIASLFDFGSSMLSGSADLVRSIWTSIKEGMASLKFFFFDVLEGLILKARNLPLIGQLFGGQTAFTDALKDESNNSDLEKEVLIGLRSKLGINEADLSGLIERNNQAEIARVAGASNGRITADQLSQAISAFKSRDTETADQITALQAIKRAIEAQRTNPVVVGNPILAPPSRV